MDNSTEVIFLLTEDDDGHAKLATRCLREAGVHNTILRFRDGDEVLGFFYGDKNGGKIGDNRMEPGQAYLLLLDIRMPRVDGVQVLKQIKADPNLKNLPIIMLTTTDDSHEIQRCYDLGCNIYVTKPVDFIKFKESIQRLGLLLLVISVPKIA